MNIFLLTFIVLLFGLLFIFSIQTSDLTRVVYLIFIYFFGGIILAHLNLYFLGLSYIIVYVGAIAILFLFILMIIPQNYNRLSTTNNSLNLWISIISIISVISIILYYIYSNYENLINIYYLTNWFKLQYNLIDIHNLTIILMGSYNFILLLIGLILWIILIGIIPLSHTQDNI